MVLIHGVLGLPEATGRLELTPENHFRFLTEGPDVTDAIKFDIPLESIKKVKLTTLLSAARLNVYTDDKKYMLGTAHLNERSFINLLPEMKQAIHLFEQAGIKVNRASVRIMAAFAITALVIIVLLMIAYIALQIVVA